MKSNHILAIALSSLAASLMTHAVQAAPLYTVSVSGASITPDGTGELSVLVSGSGESVNLIGYEFRISPTGGTTSQLQFLEESEAFLSAPNYLFAGNSFAANDGVASSVGTVSTSVLPSDTFIGGDSTNDFADLSVSGSKLLVKLAVKHLVGPADPATTIGHQFSIALVPATGDSSGFAGGTSNTGFVDSSLAGIEFGSQAAIVTVVAIPEPSSVVLALCLGLFGVAKRRRLTV